MPTGAVYETVGTIEKITAQSVTLSHQAVPAIGWPAMTMTFQLTDPKVARGKDGRQGPVRVRSTTEWTNRATHGEGNGPVIAHLIRWSVRNRFFV
jgi:hypothetical protein